MKFGESKPLGDFNHTKERFDAFVSAIRRMRWFLIIAVAISCASLLHIYLERYSYQEAQFTEYLTLADARDARINELAQRIAMVRRGEDPAVPSEDNDAFIEILSEWARLSYLQTRSRNTLDETSVKDKNLPLMGIAVPANDYLPILSMMNLIFLVGVWLNIRSIAACVYELRLRSEFSDLKDLLRLNFTFTGLVNDSDRGRLAAALVQYSALILPVSATVLAVSLDLVAGYSMVFGAEPGFPGTLQALLTRTLLLGFLIVLMIVVTQACIRRTKDLDRLIGEPEE